MTLTTKKCQKVPKSDTNDQKGENETSEFCNFVAKFFLCSLSAPSPLPLHPFFDRSSIDVR